MQGIYNIVPTPFAESGAIDEASLSRLVGFVIGTGVDTANGRANVVVDTSPATTDQGVVLARGRASGRC